MAAIDITSDDTLTLSEACALLPRGRNGAKPHLSTLLRWILQGAPAPGGQRVRLGAVRCGGKWITSRQALREFTEALTPRLASDPAPAPSRTPGRRQRAGERAGKQLEKLGI
jgi:hypothetical protein